jgi:REP element-mobilizing transposase RayT
MLDARATGPKWLARPDIAIAVAEELAAGAVNGYYELGSWVIMPNHVHILLCPAVQISRIVSGIKATTARVANRLLNRTGPFWSRNYFDRWIRDSKEEQRVVRYIENNPVKAGLCADATAWPFSNAGDAAFSRVSSGRISR